MASLLTEAAVVGAVLAVALLAAASLVRLTDPWTVLGVGFVLGAGLHLAFEAAGANAWYCRHGAACVSR